jgi:hypothetical protein
LQRGPEQKGKILSVFTIHNVVETHERKTRSCDPNLKTQPLLEDKYYREQRRLDGRIFGTPIHSSQYTKRDRKLKKLKRKKTLSDYAIQKITKTKERSFSTKSVERENLEQLE